MNSVATLPFVTLPAGALSRSRLLVTVGQADNPDDYRPRHSRPVPMPTEHPDVLAFLAELAVSL
jgi:hypothetical protein